VPRVVLTAREGLRLLNHGPVVLVTSSSGRRDDVITLAWSMPASASPPMVAIAVAPKRYSHGLIRRSREFVVNVPDSRLLPAVWLCGSVSGRDADKFAAAGLTRAVAATVHAPLIAECFGHLECRVARAFTAGDHTVFVGKVVHASVDPRAFDGTLRLRDGSQTLHHLGGPHFVTSGGRRLSAERGTA